MLQSTDVSICVDLEGITIWSVDTWSQPRRRGSKACRQKKYGEGWRIRKKIVPLFSATATKETGYLQQRQHV